MCNQRLEACIICGSDVLKYKAKFAPFLEERMFGNQHVDTDMFYCPNCNFYYSSYRPSDLEMEKLYKGYRDEHYQKQREKHEPTYTEEFNKNIGFCKNINIMRNNFLKRKIKPFIQPNRITNLLDFGGDRGQHISELYKNTTNHYVYDVSKLEPVDGVTAIGNYDELKSIKWDLITCMHVLEHVSSPLEVVEDIINLMPVGCYLYLELPDELSYFQDFCWNGGVGEYVFHEHINAFSLETVHEIFNRSDFITIFADLCDIDYKETFGKCRVISCLFQKVEPSLDALIMGQNFQILHLLKKIGSANKKTNEKERQTNKRSLLSKIIHRVW